MLKIPRTYRLAAAAAVCLLGHALGAVAQESTGHHLRTEGVLPSFGLLRDTLFLYDTSYLEIRLDRQMIYHHFRSGRVDAYTCSTGNPAIKDGIATRPGIFTVQSKAKKTLSEEFQVYLNYWMGFDGGIGMHGLDGHSYYKFLGRRASSHGCVRISNETGARLFGVIGTGTVVFVHSGSPARVLAFADSSIAGTTPIYGIDKAVLKQRLDAVRTGRWDDVSLAPRLVLPARKRLRERVDVGVVDPRLVVQYRIPVSGIPVKAGVPAPRPYRARPLGYKFPGVVIDG